MDIKQLAAKTRIPPLDITQKRRKTVEQQKPEAFKRFAVGRQMSDEELKQRKAVLKGQREELAKRKGKQ